MCSSQKVLALSRGSSSSGTASHRCVFQNLAIDIGHGDCSLLPPALANHSMPCAVQPNAGQVPLSFYFYPQSICSMTFVTGLKPQGCTINILDVVGHPRPKLRKLPLLGATRPGNIYQEVACVLYFRFLVVDQRYSAKTTPDHRLYIDSRPAFEAPRAHRAARSCG